MSLIIVRKKCVWKSAWAPAAAWTASESAISCKENKHCFLFSTAQKQSKGAGADGDKQAAGAER